MAQLTYTESAEADLDRLTAFLRESDPTAAEVTRGLIQEAVEVLRNHPLIGRAVEDDMRELVVSRGRTGYVVLYSIEQARKEVVLVLAIRHQREVGYLAEPHQ